MRPWVSGGANVKQQPRLQLTTSTAFYHITWQLCFCCRQEALEAQKEHAVMVAGRLAVFGAAGPQQPWLAAQLLSHFVGHGPRVEAAIKDISR